MDAPTPRTALLVAAFDSQLKWCAGIRDELGARGFATRVVVPDTRSALSAQQVRDAGFERVDRVPWDDLVAACLGSDVVVSALAGPFFQPSSKIWASSLGTAAWPITGSMPIGGRLLPGSRLPTNFGLFAQECWVNSNWSSMLAI